MKKNSQGKKLISFALVFALLISLFSILPLTVSAEVGDTTIVDGVTYRVTGESEASVSKFDNSTTDVKIKETVNIKGTDYTVTAIDNSVFMNNENITSINIPSGFGLIGAKIFNGCKALKDVYIYSDSAFLGYPFTGCSSLENVYCYKDKNNFGGGFDKSNLDISKFKIHGHPGSTAEALATSKGYTFVALEEETATRTVYICGPQRKLSEVGVESLKATGSYKDKPEDEKPTSHTFNASYLGFIDNYDVFELKLPVDLTTTVNFTLQGLDSSSEPVKNAQWYAAIASKTISVILGTSPNVSVSTTYDPTLALTAFQSGEFTFVTPTDTTAQLKAFDNSKTVVEIPDKVSNGDKEYTVTEINGDAFRNSNIIWVSIPGTIENMNSGFSGCKSLQTVIFNEGMKSTGSNGGIFWNCKGLKDVYFYDKEITIDSYTFENGPQKDLLTIHGYAGSTAETFAKENSIKFEPIEEQTSTEAPPVEVEPFTDGNLTFTVTGNDTVKVTKFDNKTTDVVIPEKVNHDGVEYTVVDIDDSVFKDNQKIKSVNIPGTVAFINNYVFANCSSLESVTLNEGTINIGTSAFEKTALTVIEFPKSMNKIGEYSFNGIPTLKTIKINSNASIGMYAFGGNIGLRSIYCYSDNISFDTKTFYDKGTKQETSTSRVTIYGNIESSAQKFAEEKGITFKTFDEEFETTKAPETTVSETTETTESTTVVVTTELSETTEATTVTAETTAPVGGTIEVLLGDADGSGKVDVKDVTHIQKHIAAYFALDGTAALAADVDGSGVIDVNDVTLVQKYLAAYNVEYKIGEVVQFGSDAPASTTVAPQPTDEQPTTSAQDPTTAEPEPTVPGSTIKPGSAITFYIPNYVSWLTNEGGKMWVYNDDTGEAIAAKDYQENPDGVAGYFIFDLPEGWINLSIYRTPFDTTKETFDINSKWDETTQTGVILNSWEHIGDRKSYNAYKIIGDGVPGLYETFDPNAPKSQETERTIYFDNRKSKWTNVYIYGWSFGIDQKWIQMEPLVDTNGNDLDIWSYTYYDTLPIDGVTGFLFVNKTSWSGAKQTGDLATESGKNIFVANESAGSDGKYSGTWDVYNP